MLKDEGKAHKLEMHTSVLFMNNLNLYGHFLVYKSFQHAAIAT